MTRNTDKQKAFIELLQKIDKTGEPPCAQNPDVFFPDDYRDSYEKEMAIKIAKVYCAECPIKIACAEYALVTKEQHGIWGGLTPADRGH